MTNKNTNSKNKSDFSTLLKSVIEQANKPVSNFTQRLSAWAGITTGVVSLIISVVALQLSVQQGQDHKQLDALTSIYNLNKIESDNKLKFDEAKLDKALAEIFFNIINGSDIYKSNLLKDSLNLSDLTYLDKFDDFSKKTQKILDENRLNSLIIRNKTISRAWDDYNRSLYKYNQNSYQLSINNKVIYPFLEKKLIQRKELLKEFNKTSLEFFDTLKNMTKSFPLNDYFKQNIK